ncbi:MAG: signal recognition particle-docking protein FtsY, partial [Alphaproteobacteria bacterium]|nr:signal recognition particle-docking protein FtsY [Alphaproteobacteria bacterium]
LDQLEETMILADIGIATARTIRGELATAKLNQDVSELELREWLAQKINTTLSPFAQPLDVADHKPHVIFVVGVNGAGKTTAVAKMAHYYMKQGKTVHVAACDTFRAAAKEQLEVWAQRAGFTLYSAKDGADSAALAYDALEKATLASADVLIIDTAGRLHNKKNLMDEMQKITRVLKKKMPDAPHHSLLVLDATTGQNALLQMQEFSQSISINGIIMTKLDGTAKGGIVVAIADKFKLPIYFLSVGEKLEDLQPFTSIDFARNLLGIEVNQDKICPIGPILANV